MAAVHFSHPSSLVGDLTVENGLDVANWSYNLNTAVFPTYGGEVVQILSVYIDDLTIGGTVATYSQLEAIYSYFAAYIQIATQGKTSNPQPGQSAYVLTPITFTYPERGWQFQIHPKQAAGFQYSYDMVAPKWQIVCFVEDDSANTSITDIKDAIASQAIAEGLSTFRRINGEIAPDNTDPETNPFQTYDPSATQAKVSSALTNVADYYNTLLPYPNTAGSSGNGATRSGPASSPATGRSQAPTSKVMSRQHGPSPS